LQNSYTQLKYVQLNGAMIDFILKTKKIKNITYFWYI